MIRTTPTRQAAKNAELSLQRCPILRVGGAGNIQYEPGASHCAKKEVLKEKCSDGGMSQEHGPTTRALSS